MNDGRSGNSDFPERGIAGIYLRNSSRNFLLFFIPFIFFLSLLFLPLPQGFFRYDFSYYIVLYLPFMYWAFSRKGFWGNVLSFSSLMLLFAMPLSRCWTGLYNYSAYELCGIFPWSDAQAFYNSTRSFIERGTLLKGHAAARPVYQGYLITLLGLTCNNIMLVQAFMTSLCAGACFLASREIQRTNGVFPGILFALFSFLFYRFFIGSLLSENIGFPLGLLGFYFLWRGASLRNLKSVLWGIFFVSLALNARAGLFPVLPLLILWAGWVFRADKKYFSFRNFLLACAAALIPFLLNAFLRYLICDPESVPFMSCPLLLYQFFSGSDDYMQLFRDYPDIKGFVPGPMYSAVFNAMLEHPFGWLASTGRNLGEFFSSGAFCYITRFHSFPIQVIMRIFLLFFSAAAFVYSFRRWRRPCASLIIVFTIGTLVSVPLIPPWVMHNLREYAATVSFIYLLPVLGVFFIFSKLAPVSFLFKPVRIRLKGLSWIFTGLFLVLIFAGPFLYQVLPRFSPAMKAGTTKELPPGKEQVIAYIYPGTYVYIVNDEDVPVSRLPYLRVSDFNKNLGHWDCHAQIARQFSGACPISLLTYVCALRGGRSFFLVLNPAPVDNLVYGLFIFTGERKGDIFYADSYRKLMSPE